MEMMFRLHYHVYVPECLWLRQLWALRLSALPSLWVVGIGVGHGVPRVSSEGCPAGHKKNVLKVVLFRVLFGLGGGSSWKGEGLVRSKFHLKVAPSNEARNFQLVGEREPWFWQRHALRTLLKESGLVLFLPWLVIPSQEAHSILVLTLLWGCLCGHDSVHSQSTTTNKEREQTLNHA